MTTRSVCVVALFLVVAACSPLEPITETLTEPVEIESVDLPGRLWDPFLPPVEDGRPVTVEALLTLPPTDSPVPGVIITHGCGGVSSAELGWTDVLAEAGIASLVVDSFGARGIEFICSGEQTINVASPIIDVFRAAEVLDRHPYVDGSQLAVMGFSFGGRAALWSALSRIQELYGGRPFQAHVAFYPSTCFIELQDETVTGGPLRIFHGTADDWTPIDQCERMVDRWNASGADASIFAYPDAPHSFDNVGLAWGELHASLAALSPRNCTFFERNGAIIDLDTGEVAGVGSPCVEAGVTYGYDADARVASEGDLLGFLGGVFGESPSS